MSIRRNSGLGTWRAFILAAVAIAAGGVLLSGQITVPNTFVNGTVADAPQVNANFNTLASNALNRTGGTMTGTLTTQAVLPSADATYALGSGAFRYTTGNFSGLLTAGTGTFSGLVTGGSFAGTGAALTTLSAANISAGILASARGGVGIDASAPTDGQLLVGKTSDGSWNKATITPGTGITVTNGGGTITVASSLASPALIKLIAAHGANTAAGSTTLSSIAISGLTVDDHLIIMCALSPVGGTMSQVNFVDTTDAVSLGSANNGNTMGTAAHSEDNFTVFADPASSVKTRMTSMSALNGTPTGIFWGATMVTAWTGSWTLGLVGGGMTAGTLNWSWAVFKVAGQ